jgi:hypothetical protein
MVGFSIFWLGHPRARGMINDIKFNLSYHQRQFLFFLRQGLGDRFSKLK